MPKLRIAAVAALVLALPACQNALSDAPDGPLTGTWRYTATEYRMFPYTIPNMHCHAEITLHLRQNGSHVFGESEPAPRICVHPVTGKPDTLNSEAWRMEGEVENGRVHFSFSGDWHSFGELHPTQIEGYLEAYEGLARDQPIPATRSGHFVLTKTSDVGYDGPEDF
ncbi:MAG TPA: hypothetical protein VF092_12930 [Longimicrobium sp.]